LLREKEGVCAFCVGKDTETELAFFSIFDFHWRFGQFHAQKQKESLLEQCGVRSVTTARALSSPGGPHNFLKGNFFTLRRNTFPICQNSLFAYLIFLLFFL